MKESINVLHQKYVSLTGMPLSLHIGRIWIWELWQLKGWTGDDLELVVNHLRRVAVDRKKPKTWLPACFRFDNLIRNTDLFEENLSEARALARVPKPNYRRQEVVKATGRTEEPKTGFRTSEEVLASPAFQALLSIRDSV